jgi:hypothetical protein
MGGDWPFGTGDQRVIRRGFLGLKIGKGCREVRMDEEQLILQVADALTPICGSNLVKQTEAVLRERSAPGVTRSVSVTPEHLHMAADTVVIARFIVSAVPLAIAQVKQFTNKKEAKQSLLETIKKPSVVSDEVVERLADKVVERI